MAHRLIAMRPTHASLAEEILALLRAAGRPITCAALHAQCTRTRGLGHTQNTLYRLCITGHVVRHEKRIDHASQTRRLHFALRDAGVGVQPHVFSRHDAPRYYGPTGTPPERVRRISVGALGGAEGPHPLRGPQPLLAARSP